MMEGNWFEVNRQDPQLNPVLFPAIVLQSTGDTKYIGWGLQGRWVHSTGSGENTLQFSVDRMDLEYPFLADDLHNLTLNYESRRRTGERNEVYWGVGFQQYWDASAPPYQ